MTTIIKQTTIILILSLGLVLAVLPLANTEWAQNMRMKSEQDTRSNERNQRGESSHPQEFPSVLRYTLPFAKELVLMGLPGLFTLGILGFARKRRHTASFRNETEIN